MAAATTTAQLSKELGAAKTVGDARSVAGKVLTHLSRSYSLVKVHFTVGPLGTSYRTALDRARLRVEVAFKSMSLLDGTRKLVTVMKSGPPIEDPRWVELKKAIGLALGEAAAVEGAAGYKPVTSNAEILVTSVKEAPQVFGKAVGTTVGAVGQGAGQALGGLLGGLGVWGILLVAILAASILFRMGVI